MKFIKPFDGAMFGSVAGKISGNSLIVEFTLSAEPGRSITINKVPASENNSVYTATIQLDGYRNTVEAYDTVSGESETAVVYWLKNADYKYRLSLDDNIWCLQDIAKNQHIYSSLFENPLLGFYKSVHDKYGTKIHMNIYNDCPEFCGFTLAEFPDKYKDEFIANSDWFKLAFHAARNLPDRIYENSSYEEVRDDMLMVYEQIVRFAGEETLSRDVTTIHWGCATKYGVRAMRTMGIRALLASFRAFDDGTSDINLHLNYEQTKHVHTYLAYKDHAEDMICVANDLYLNGFTPEGIRQRLDSRETDFPQRRFKDLLMHEQYFYPFYVAYEPDFRERVITGVEWCVEHGYKPAFLKEILFED
ncbi:MAG: hypothetical protein GX633_10135 [Clostridiales bacterium]|nr:hypothetical protein [Clostridiales bacterium]